MLALIALKTTRFLSANQINMNNNASDLFDNKVIAYVIAAGTLPGVNT